MEPIKDLALKIIENIEVDHIKDIKSYVGFIEFTCEIVEEVYRRSKVKISSENKKKLAIELNSFVLDKLIRLELIGNDLAKNINYIIDNTNFGGIIDDVVNIWKRKKHIFCPCIKSKTIRNIKIKSV